MAQTIALVDTLKRTLKAQGKTYADVAEAKSRVAAANVKAAKAALGEVDQELKDAELYAPVGGIIRERIVEPGDFVTPQSPVLTLALTDPVWIRTYLPESFLGQVKPGAAAKITTDSFPDKSYEGWVGSISPTSEFTPKNVDSPELRTRLVYQVRVIADNPDQVEKAKQNPKLAGWFTGQVLKATGGKANPKAVTELVTQKLGL